MSDVETELSRLKKIIMARSSTLDQVRAANAARNKLLEAMITEAFNRIEQRTELYEQLVDKLDDIVDDIKANRLTTVADDLTGLLEEVKAAADGTPQDGD